MNRDQSTDLLLARSITGTQAMAYTIAAVAVPTLIRVAVDGFVSGCELTVYLPFVLLSAILMGWRRAAVVALASGLVAEVLLMGLHHDQLVGPCIAYSVGIFAVSSAAIIGAVHSSRSVIASCVAPFSSNAFSHDGVVFSLRDGKAWASWYGHDWSVQLGPEDEVAYMMDDFLKQKALGKRLAEQSQ